MRTLIATARAMYRAYLNGLSYKPGAVLRPKPDARIPGSFLDDAVDGVVVVHRQRTLAPHTYDAIYERKAPKSPADRFVLFEINGHDWELIG